MIGVSIAGYRKPAARVGSSLVALALVSRICGGSIAQRNTTDFSPPSSKKWLRHTASKPFSNLIHKRMVSSLLLMALLLALSACGGGGSDNNDDGGSNGGDGGDGGNGSSPQLASCYSVSIEGTVKEQTFLGPQQPPFFRAPARLLLANTLTQNTQNGINPIEVFLQYGRPFLFEVHGAIQFATNTAFFPGDPASTPPEDIAFVNFDPNALTVSVEPDPSAEFAVVTSSRPRPASRRITTLSSRASCRFSSGAMAIR